jgi:transcriptional regulator with XRE-family HTH domain
VGGMPFHVLELVSYMQTTETAGQRLRKRREELHLRYRDVEEASQKIAARRGSDEYAVAISRLADVENRAALPSIFKLYSLCAIYRIDLLEVLQWYGVDASALPGDAASVDISKTHMLQFLSHDFGEVQLPIALDPGMDPEKTTYLSRMIQRWGKMPLMLLNGLDIRSRRYALIGTEDWSMHPLIQPGSLVMVDESKRKIQPGPWESEQERPIYFLEHREGFTFGWCNLEDKEIVISSHPTSGIHPRAHQYPQEIEIVGQIVAVATRLDQSKRRRKRS